MDRGLRLRTPHRSTVGPAHPSRSHPGDEWRQLPPQAKPPQTKPILRTLNLPRRMRFGGEGPLPLRSRAPSPPKNPALPSTLLVPFYSAQWSPFTPALTMLRSGATTSTSDTEHSPFWRASTCCRARFWDWCVHGTAARNLSSFWNWLTRITRRAHASASCSTITPRTFQGKHAASWPRYRTALNSHSHPSTVPGST